MKTCSTCHMTLPDDARFCPADGTPVSQAAAPAATPAHAASPAPALQPTDGLQASMNVPVHGWTQFISTVDADGNSIFAGLKPPEPTSPEPARPEQRPEQKPAPQPEPAPSPASTSLFVRAESDARTQVYQELPTEVRAALAARDAVVPAAAPVPAPVVAAVPAPAPVAASPTIAHARQTSPASAIKRPAPARPTTDDDDLVPARSQGGLYLAVGALVLALVVVAFLLLRH